jgi:hypothetical protein
MNVRRIAFAFILTTAAAIVMIALAIYLPKVASPFFEALGGNQNFGTTGNEAIDVGGGLTVVALSILAIPMSLAVFLFMRRRRQRAGPRQRR